MKFMSVEVTKNNQIIVSKQTDAYLFRKLQRRQLLIAHACFSLELREYRRRNLQKIMIHAALIPPLHLVATRWLTRV